MIVYKKIVSGEVVEHTINGVPQMIKPLISKLRKPCVGCGKKAQNLDAKREITDSPQT